MGLSAGRQAMEGLPTRRERLTHNKARKSSEWDTHRGRRLLWARTGDGGRGPTLARPLLVRGPLSALASLAPALSSLAGFLRERCHHPWFCRDEAWGPEMQGLRKCPLSSWKDIEWISLTYPDVFCRNHVKTCRVGQGKSGYYRGAVGEPLILSHPSRANSCSLFFVLTVLANVK